MTNLLTTELIFFISLSSVMLFIALALIFVSNMKRWTRRLFMQKVKFIQSDDRGQREVYGYVVSWNVIAESYSPGEDDLKAKLKNIGKDFRVNGTLIFIIIEPAKPHPELGYQNVLIESKFVKFL